MSKIGVKPIIIAEGVTVEQTGQSLVFHGSLGEMTLIVPESITILINEKQINLSRKSEEKKVKSLHGTYARLIANAIKGVSVGFTKTLEVVGTGFRAEMQGDTLILSIGFSHQIKFPTPTGISLSVKENNKIDVTGINKETVGLIADRIKRFRQPDAYKGKGIRYLGEKLRLKPGKAAAKTTGAK